MYGCEIWSLIDSSVHTIGVAWNNCSGEFLLLLEREYKGSSELYVLPIPYLTDQRRLIFGARFATWKIWCYKHCHF